MPFLRELVISCLLAAVVGPNPAVAAPAGSPMLEDGASLAGVEFHHFNGATGAYYFPEIMGSGAAFFDLEDDGDLDLYLVQGALLGQDRTLADALFPPQAAGTPKDRLLRNDTRAGGPLRFTDVTEASGLAAAGFGMGVATGDIDNDGDVDLYLSNFGPNQLWRNDGDGTFTEVTASAGAGDDGWTVPALFFDYDSDGWLDLFLGDYVGFKLAGNVPCRSAAGVRDYCSPSVYPPTPDRLLRNDGDGTFTDVSAKVGLATVPGAALGAQALDANDDGRMDLYVANDGLPNRLWIQQDDGTFVDEALFAGCAVDADGQSEASMGVAAGDADGDGDTDLFLSHLDRETNTLYLNQGGGLFIDASAAGGLAAPSLDRTGFGTAFFDLDNDSHQDLLVVNGAVTILEGLARAQDPFPFHQPNQLFRNLGGGRFADITAASGEALNRSLTSRGGAFGDVDNDGDTDVLVTNNNGPAQLLINHAADGTAWVGLRLVTGPEGAARDALGARVEVHLEGPQGKRRAWTRWVSTGGSYASAGDPRLIFGLGGEGASIPEQVRVEVRWPGPRGEVEIFDRVPTGTYTTLRRGEGRKVGAEP